MNMNEHYIYSNYSSECQFHLLQCLLLFYTQVTFRCASLVHHHSTNQARLAKAVGDPKIPSLFPLEVAANGGVVPIDLLSRRFGVCKKNDGERNRPFNNEVRDWTLDIKQLNLPSCRFSLVAQEEPEKLMTCSRNRLIDLFPNMALNIVVLSQQKPRYQKIFDFYVFSRTVFCPAFVFVFFLFGISKGISEVSRLLSTFLVREPRSEVGSGIRGQIPLRSELLRSKVEIHEKSIISLLAKITNKL